MASSWTEKRVQKLIELWKEGHSASVCAAYLGGVTRNSVIAKIHRLREAGNHGLQRQTISKPISARLMARAKKRHDKFSAIAGFGMVKEAAPFQNPSIDVAELDRPQIDDEIGVKSFVDLEDNQCRWPIGDPKSDDFGWCGKARVPGRPYCEGHCARAYESPAVRKRKTHHGEVGGFRFENDNSRKPEKEVENVDT